MTMGKTRGRWAKAAWRSRRATTHTIRPHGSSDIIPETSATGADAAHAADRGSTMSVSVSSLRSSSLLSTSKRVDGGDAMTLFISQNARKVRNPMSRQGRRCVLSEFTSLPAWAVSLTATCVRCRSLQPCERCALLVHSCYLFEERNHAPPPPHLHLCPPRAP